MKILSTNELDALQADLGVLLQKYGLTSGYLVAEIRPDADQPGDFCTVVKQQVKGYKVTAMLSALADQTYAIMRGMGIPQAPQITDN